MSARQNTNLRAEWTHFVELTTIWTNAIFDDVFADIALDGKLESIIIVGTIVLGVILGASSHFFFIAHFVSNAGFFVGNSLRELIMHRPAELIDKLIALHSVLGAELSADFAVHPRINASLDSFTRKNKRIFLFFDADLSTELVLKLDSRLNHLESPFETTNNDILWNFISASFNHRDTRIFTGNYEVEIRRGTLFLGKDAFGMIDPEGGGLEMIVKSKEQAGGPLNQFSTLGYKFSTATKILYQDRMVRVESLSEYSGTDEAN